MGSRLRALRRIALGGVLLALVGLPAGVAQSASAVDREAEARRLRADHAGWLLPAWTSGGPAAWTVVGAPRARLDTLVGRDGSFAPRNHGPSVSYWLYDLDNGRLIDPAQQQPTLQLDDGRLPIVTSRWQAGDFGVELTTFVGGADADVDGWFAGRVEPTNPTTYARLSVTTTSAAPRRVAAYFGVRPFGIERELHDIETAACTVNPATLAVNDAIMVAGIGPADGCGAATLRDDDVSAYAQRGALPPERFARDPNGRAEAVLRFALQVGPGQAASAELRAPSEPIGYASGLLSSLTGGPSFDDTRALVAAGWRQATGRTTLETSDPRIAQAFAASQAYLLLNRRGPLLRSGPLAHDAFWTRDAAYIGEALERVGYGAENAATLDVLLAAQQSDGSFPAILDANRRPMTVEEWDAPGQAIYSLVTHYRFSRDRAWLERVYPAAVRAAGYLDALRGRTAQEGPETRGLLPANLSAEDLGPATWHHYWDDFWALAGYRELAYAARELGKREDADAFSAKAERFQQDVLASVALVQQRTGFNAIPNGPEDVLSSSMARGTTPALWPARSVVGQDALLGRAFERYFDAWLAPQGGGYRHYEGTVWPYGGLGIAHAELRLGQLPQVWRVLNWTLEHQPLPGTYAWGEGLNPGHLGLEVGDMPHSWAAAEYVSLVRDLIVAEDGADPTRLVVNSGIPDAWLEPGKRVALLDAPTQAGPVSVRLGRVGDDLEVRLDGDPPGGWQVRFPATAGTPASVTVDGARVSPASAETLQVARGPHMVVARYAAPRAATPDGACATDMGSAEGETRDC